MTALVWDEAPIAKRHDRAAFDCGDADLNLYLHKYARQNHESGGAKCFVAAPLGAPAHILGFYTLAPRRWTMRGRRRWPGKDWRVTTFRCSALAGSRSIDRFRAGASAARCCSAPRIAACVSREDVGGVALLIDAKNEHAARWYESYGALALGDAPLSLVLPLAVAADALKRGT